MIRSDPASPVRSALAPRGSWHQPEELLPLLRGLEPGLDDAGLRDLGVRVLLGLAERDEAMVVDGWPPHSGEVTPVALGDVRARLAEPLIWSWTSALDRPPLALALTAHGASLATIEPRWRLLGFDGATDELDVEHVLERPDDATLRRRLHLPPHDELLDAYPVPAEELDWWADLVGAPLPDRLAWFAEA